MFSIGEAILFGWQKFKENWQIAILGTIIILVVNILGNSDNAIILILALIIGMVWQIGFIKSFLKICDNIEVGILNIFTEFRLPLFLKYIAVSILVSIISLIGFVFLVIPGVILYTRLSLSTMYMLDKNSSIKTAMKESWEMTRGSFWKLFLFGFTLCLINLVGFILFGIGLIVSIPVSLFSLIFIYRKLMGARAGILTT